jgi:hypothetical protein
MFDSLPCCRSRCILPFCRDFARILNSFSEKKRQQMILHNITIDKNQIEIFCKKWKIKEFSLRLREIFENNLLRAVELFRSGEPLVEITELRSFGMHKS